MLAPATGREISQIAASTMKGTAKVYTTHRQRRREDGAPPPQLLPVWVLLLVTLRSRSPRSLAGEGLCPRMSILASRRLILTISIGSRSQSSRIRYREVTRRLRRARYPCRRRNCPRNDKWAAAQDSKRPRIYQVEPHIRRRAGSDFTSFTYPPRTPVKLAALISSPSNLKHSKWA